MTIEDRDLGMRKILQQMQITTSLEVAVGVFQGQQDSDGVQIAEYGAYNEFGANIQIAARSQRIYRRINKDGSFFRGKSSFVKKEKSNFESWVTMGAYEVNIPSRPFMATSFDENKDKINRDVDLAIGRIASGKSTAQQALNRIGQKHADRIKNTITGRNFLPSLATSTVAAKKGSTKTLVDTGALVNAIHPEIRARQS